MKFNLFNCKAFRKKKHVAQGGAILDQVISESCSPNNKVLLYKLANYKLGSSRLRNNPSSRKGFFSDVKKLEVKLKNLVPQKIKT